jgi:hypothetical protein
MFLYRTNWVTKVTIRKVEISFDSRAVSVGSIPTRDLVRTEAVLDNYKAKFMILAKCTIGMGHERVR